MTIPALLDDFPSTSSPEHASRSRQLGKQWNSCVVAGNYFFRPSSSAGALGYAFTAYHTSRSLVSRSDWRLYGFCAVLHAIVVVHSAVNMQPINVRLVDMGTRTQEKKAEDGEGMLRSWAKLNLVRLVCPLIAGTVALYNSSF